MGKMGQKMTRRRRDTNRDMPCVKRENPGKPARGVLSLFLLSLFSFATQNYCSDPLLSLKIAHLISSLSLSVGPP